MRGDPFGVDKLILLVLTLKSIAMKKHVPYLLSLLSIMGLLAWTASVRAQCLSDKTTLDLPIASTATDLSDHAHSVNITGASYVNGEDGSANGALSFAGQGQYATIPADPAFEQMSEGFTIAAWVYPTAFQSYNAVVTKLNGGHRNIIFRYHNDGKFQVHFTNSNNAITAVTTDGAVVSTGQWTHLAATWDGTDMKLFVNGQIEKEMTLSFSPNFQSAGSIRLGTLNFGSERMVGYLDNVQMRAFPTPEDEVACLMRAEIGAENGIELHLPLNNSSTDISDNSNNATFYSVGVGTDRWGNIAEAVNLTGSGYATVPNISIYEQLENEFTISAWIKPNAVGGTQAIIGKAGTGRDIVLRIDNGKLTAHYYVSGYVWCTPATATISANEWSHVACTWDGTNLAVYHNGEMLQSVAPATLPNFTSNSWSIGALTASGGEQFAGMIDEVKVWHRFLSICEIRSDIHANLDLVTENDLLLCEGQTQTVSAPGGFCSYLWLNDNSTDNSFTIDASNLGVGNHEIVLEAYDLNDNFYQDTVDVTVSLCTGIDDESIKMAIDLYPNPATDAVTVRGENFAAIQLFDASGRMVITETSNNRTEVRLDVSELGKGVFTIRAATHTGTVVTKRLVKL